MAIAALSGWTSEQKHVVAASFLGWSPSLTVLSSETCWRPGTQRFVRLSRRKPVATAGAGQRRKIGVRKFDRLAKWHEADAFGFQRDQSQRH